MANETLPSKQTGEDIPVDITLSILSFPDISVLPQIIVVFYYVRLNILKKFSFHAVDIADQDLIDEALREDRTVRQITLNGNTLEMVIDKSDTDLLDIPEKEKVCVFAMINYFEPSGAKRKVPKDSGIVTMEKSVTEGLL